MKRIMLTVGMLVTAGSLFCAPGKTGDVAAWESDKYSSGNIDTVQGCLPPDSESMISNSVSNAKNPVRINVKCKLPGETETQGLKIVAKEASANAVGDKKPLKRDFILQKESFTPIDLIANGTVPFNVTLPKYNKSVGIVIKPLFGLYAGKDAYVIVTYGQENGVDKVMFKSCVNYPLRKSFDVSSKNNLWTEMADYKIRKESSKEDLKFLQNALRNNTVILADGSFIIKFNDPMYTDIHAALNPEAVLKYKVSTSGK